MVKLVDAQKLMAVVEFAADKMKKREEASMFCPGNRKRIMEEFQENVEAGRLAAYWSDGKPEGVISWYVDEEKLRTDCALLVNSECENYENVALSLVQEAQKGQRSGMRYYFYFPKENRRCMEFLEKLKAHREENEYLLLLHKEIWENRGCERPGEDEDGKKKPPIEIRVLPKERYEEYTKLHDAVFPDIYISGRDVISDLGKNHQVFVLLEGDKIAAFCVLNTHGNKRATAELIGVRRDKRGQGYGKAVLSYLAFRAFALGGMEALDLIVDSDNENALRLYLDFGFQVECENRSYWLES